MFNRIALTLLALAASAIAAGAQTLAQRVTQTDGIVHVIFPSRPTACGDGERMIGGVFGRSTYYSDYGSYTRRDGSMERACVHGPTRVVATVVGGQVTRLRSFVGPLPASRADVRVIDVSAVDAAGWLSSVVQAGDGRSASDAMLPLVLADGSAPWPLLLRVARDDSRSRNARHSAMDWLAQGVNDHLGLTDADPTSDTDEMRTQAVFVLSQRPKSESVPELIDLARAAKYPSVRKSAIFWLGQTGDPRAADVYAALLGLR